MHSKNFKVFGVHLFYRVFFFVWFLANERVLIDFSDKGKNPGFLPDGLTIDTDGNLYVTKFGGSSVVKVNPK